jgi:hypothetical protein
MGPPDLQTAATQAGVDHKTARRYVEAAVAAVWTEPEELINSMTS